ncbi:MAG TPA: gephyrin-like molybdotransferase Glp [Acidobacteriaceae bacterium]|nr:gephyrin-like molybdotransferase Glp [Acidobacteriaceae bacterium]
MRFNQPPQISSPTPSASPISFTEAASIVAAQAMTILSTPTLEQEQCELSEGLGRILALPVIAERDQPPFPRVTRDGFAIRAEDVSSSAPLRVIGQFRAGEKPSSSQPPLAPGEAIEIMTGAPLPPGADAVLMVEHAEEVSAERVPDADRTARSSRRIRPVTDRTLRVGENVVVQGSEARKGDVLLEAGTRLLPDEIVLTASCGLDSIFVYRQPKVAILATGDELRELSRPGSTAAAGPIESHQIYDSNSESLSALVRQAGGIPIRQRAARDEKSDLTTCIREAWKHGRLLLLTGGVSMGRYDLVEQVLTSLGAEFFFTGVKMQPGKPVVFGQIPARDNQPQRFFFGLPGNPVSVLVTFRVFVQPLLAALAGEGHWQPKTALASMAADLQFKPGLTRFVPARLQTSQALPTVIPVVNRGSGDLAANARANCYAIVPEDCGHLVAGQTVQILLR